MLAGGCVRDRLLGRIPKDYDIATTAHPEQVLNLFRKGGFKVIPTGIDHGTVTLVMDGEPIEITTLRRDVETDGRRAVVAFGNTFAEDAERRDFTINALYMDRQGAIHDFHQGQEDIRNGRLRFVGEADARIREDYLRIMRLFRFWGRFGFQPDPGALDAVEQLCPGIAQISQERITSELIAILSGEHVAHILGTMISTGVMAVIIPEVTDWRLADLTKAEAMAAVPMPYRPLAVLASLTATAPHLEGVEELARRLRLSLEQQKWFRLLRHAGQALAKVPDSPAAAMEVIDDIESQAGEGGFANLFTPFARSHADASEQISVQTLDDCENRFGALRRAKLPINGNEVMSATGLRGGAVLGQVMRALLHGFRNQEWRTREEGLELAEHIAASIRSP